MYYYRNKIQPAGLHATPMRATSFQGFDIDEDPCVATGAGSGTAISLQNHVTKLVTEQGCWAFFRMEHLIEMA